MEYIKVEIVDLSDLEPFRVKEEHETEEQKGWYLILINRNKYINDHDNVVCICLP